MLAKALCAWSRSGIGSGTRLKILEAESMAKTMVSTALGAEGLDSIHGEQIRRAGEPAALARTMADLLGDKAARGSMGRGARGRVESRCGQPVLREALRAALSGGSSAVLPAGRAGGR